MIDKCSCGSTCSQVEALKTEVERLARALKLAQAGWRSGDATDFLSTGQNTMNIKEVTND